MSTVGVKGLDTFLSCVGCLIDDVCDSCY